MTYDVSKAKLGDVVWGMEFEGIVDKFTIKSSSYDDDDTRLWISGGGIKTPLRNDHILFTTREEAEDYCAIYRAQVYDEYRKLIDDQEDLIKFMYDNFVTENASKDNRFRRKVKRDVIREKALYFGIKLGEWDYESKAYENW